MPFEEDSDVGEEFEDIMEDEMDLDGRTDPTMDDYVQPVMDDELDADDDESVDAYGVQFPTSSTYNTTAEMPCSNS